VTDLNGEFGTIKGVVFADEDGNPLPPYDPSKCSECKSNRDSGTWWDAHQFWPWGSMTRWRCPCGHTWVN
jgi:hypothetical protein